MTNELINKQVAANGSETSDSVGLAGTESFNLDISGDGSTTDINIVVMSSQGEGERFSQMDVIKNLNLGNKENNGINEQFTASKTEQIKCKVVENAGNQTQVRISEDH